MIAEQLKSMPLFEGLPESDLDEVAKMFQQAEMLAGSGLASEGDFAYKFFVVLDGEVEVHREFKPVDEMGAGEFFGEIGLLTGQRRNARVVAKTRCNVAWMMGWDFQTMMEQYPVVAERINAVIAERQPPAP